MLAIAALAAVAACGGEDGGAPGGSQPRTDAAPTTSVAATTDGGQRTVTDGGRGAGRRPTAGGTRIAVRGSQFGAVLFGPRRRAIYIFERDSEGRSACHGSCAEAWPPVFTDGEPVAGRGVDASLLGTVKRRDGRQQVSYAGRPLYFYAHEGPGEVRCHNVNLDGGLWWVVGPDGRRRP